MENSSVFGKKPAEASDKQGSQKKGKPLKGIVCDVQNCVHHDGECHCTAEQIAVGPSYACACSDTVCATFREKPGT